MARDPADTGADEEEGVLNADGTESPADEASGGPEGASEQAQPAHGDAAAGGAAQEVVALKDQLLRNAAEMENVRRRAARDVENAHKFALEKFTADLLPVIDSLEKAVEAARAASAEGGEMETAIAEGVELSLKMFYDVLERAGVQRIDPLGEPFDPNLHEAMTLLESPHAEPNSVLDVMQKGYTLNGRLVRAAMVVVSKAPADA
jgi:molecular chaperone GrpE